MIRKRDLLIPGGEGQPDIVSNEHSVLPCGCVFMVGLRVDTKEAAAVAYTCKPEHNPLMERVYELLTVSLTVPTDRPLIDVLDQMMVECWSELDE